MLAAGPLTATGMWFHAYAEEVAPANFTTSFEYTSIMWAGRFGYLVSADVPSAATWYGAAVVMAAGLLMIKRDRAAGYLWVAANVVGVRPHPPVAREGGGLWGS